MGTINLHPFKSRTEIRTLSFLVTLYAGVVLVGVGAEKERAAKARRKKLKGPTSIMLDQRCIQQQALDTDEDFPVERPNVPSLITRGYS